MTSLREPYKDHVHSTSFVVHDDHEYKRIVCADVDRLEDLFQTSDMSVRNAVEPLVVDI